MVNSVLLFRMKSGSCPRRSSAALTPRTIAHAALPFGSSSRSSDPHAPCPTNPASFARCATATRLEFTSVEACALKSLTLFRFRISAPPKPSGRGPHFAQFWCNISPFRINTSKSVSKQRTLTTSRMNTYEKQAVGGGVGFSVAAHPHTSSGVPHSICS